MKLTNINIKINPNDVFVGVKNFRLIASQPGYHNYMPDATACLPCNLPEDINPSYWRISNCVSICCNVSRITPTMISNDVPPKNVAKFADIEKDSSIKPGRIPTKASKIAPGNVILSMIVPI